MPRKLHNGFLALLLSAPQISLSDGGPSTMALSTQRSCCTRLDNHLRIAFADSPRTMEITNRRKNSSSQPLFFRLYHEGRVLLLFLRRASRFCWIGAFIKIKLKQHFNATFFRGQKRMVCGSRSALALYVCRLNRGGHFECSTKR